MASDVIYVSGTEQTPWTSSVIGLPRIRDGPCILGSGSLGSKRNAEANNVYSV